MAALVDNLVLDMPERDHHRFFNEDLVLGRVTLDALDLGEIGIVIEFEENYFNLGTLRGFICHDIFLHTIHMSLR